MGSEVLLLKGPDQVQLIRLITGESEQSDRGSGNRQTGDLQNKSLATEGQTAIVIVTTFM